MNQTMKTIDISTWKRKEHFDYFCSLDDPYWSITTELDCTETYKLARSSNSSFFLHYLHRTLKAASKVEELRLRIVDNQVVCYEILHASATVLREDETFGCCFIEFMDDFADFAANARAEIAKTLQTSGMCLENDYKLNQIHVSSIPWCNFSALTYAKALKPQDSVPKITFGKLQTNNEKTSFAVSMQVHHGLVDGLHVARFLQHLQELLNQGQG